MTLRSVVLVSMSWVAGAAAASGQVLLTAETLGSGSQALAASANLIAPKDFGTLVNFWVQYGYGVADRVDVFAAYGNISVFDETQHYVAVGSSIGVLRRDRHGLDVSFFSNVSTPLTRRDQAAVLFGTFALIGSRPLQVGSIVVTPYGGLEAVVPAGHRARGIFTPVETLFAGIAGLAVPLNKSWTAYVEVNPGPNLRSAGVAIAVLVPRQRPAKQRTSPVSWRGSGVQPGLDASIRNKPNQRDGDIQRVRDPRIHEGKRDRCNVEPERDPALRVISDGLRKSRVWLR